jgi:hypothetical protein
MEYEEFVQRKGFRFESSGIDGPHKIPDSAFDFQRDIITWALKLGRAAIFADCGLGKTLMQLAWADNVPGKVLILAPLAVAQQTIREGEKFGITNLEYLPEDTDASGNIITNYERLDNFDLSKYSGIVLDESSILKNYTGKVRNTIIEKCQDIPYRLACTATPAPNDFMELGNHAEFLGVMSRTEMLSMYFVHDGGETQKWRLKGHAEEPFWKWLCSWAVMIRKPSDLGYDDGGFVLPKLNYFHHVVKSEKAPEGMLFAVEAQSLQERQQARKASIEDRVAKCAKIINDDQWLVWCNLNSESDLLKNAIEGAIEVKGSDSSEHKESSMLSFASGGIKTMVSKPSICGLGMNFQNCHNMAYVGLSDSFEQLYQSTRRCWRFGQKHPVNVHIITAETEGAVVKNIKRKEQDAKRMADEMVKHMSVLNTENIKGLSRTVTTYDPNLKMQLPQFLKEVKK